MLTPLQTLLRAVSTMPCTRQLILVPALLAVGCNQSVPPAVKNADTYRSAVQKEPANIMTTLTGTAMSGTVVQGLITAYSVRSQGYSFELDPQPLTRPVRTGSDGRFELKLPVGTPAPVLLHLTVDGRTTITCDVTSGCKTSDNRTVTFGQRFAPPQDFTLFTALPRLNQGAQSAPITPLTHLAFRWAESQRQGLNPDNILQGRERAASLLDFHSNMLDRAPLNLTKVQHTESVDAEHMRYSLTSAAFMALANAPTWIDITDVLETAAQRFAATGTLPNVNLGGLPQVTKSDLFYAAAELALGLSDQIDTTPGDSVVIDDQPNTANPVEPDTSAPVVAQPSTGSSGADSDIPPPSNIPPVSPPVVMNPSPQPVEPETPVMPDMDSQSPANEQPIEEPAPVVDITPESSPADVPEQPIEAPVEVVLDDIAEEAASAADELIETGNQVEPARVTFNPSDITLYEQESATLNVNASGTAPITYQWRKDGVAIPGATSEHLMISTASTEDAGVYDCIVSNEAGSVTSTSAELTVKDTGLTLAWSVPTERVDGSPIEADDLLGYRVFYGTSAESLTEEIELQDPAVTQYRINDLPPGTYYFAIQAIDNEGHESPLSGIIEAEL